MAPSPMITRCNDEANSTPMTSMFKGARTLICCALAGSAMTLTLLAAAGAITKTLDTRAQDFAKALQAAQQEVLHKGGVGEVHTAIQNGSCAYSKLRGFNSAGNMVVEVGACDEETGLPTGLTGVKVVNTETLKF